LNLLKQTVMFYTRGRTEMRMAEHARARGICPWCQRLISSKHQAVRLCNGCEDFDPADDGKVRYAHVKCAIENGCKRCEKGDIIRVQ